MFGPEIGMAKAFSAGFDGETYIVKYAYGGTSLDPLTGNGNNMYWNPPSSVYSDLKNAGTLYTNLCNHIEDAIAVLEKQGLNPKIEALCWMQGENDACLPTHSRYGTLEQEFVTSLRDKYSDVASDYGIAFINGGITDVWVYHNEINNAKKQNCKDLDSAVYIDTIGMKLEYDKEPSGAPDRSHLDATSMVKLGIAFRFGYFSFHFVTSSRIKLFPSSYRLNFRSSQAIPLYVSLVGVYSINF